MKSRVSADLVLGVGFGSEGKGNICGYLSENKDYDTVLLQYSMNAGHTYIDSRGEKFVHMAFPNGVFSPSLKRILWGPGSVLNMETWNKERLNLLEKIPSFSQVELWIHPNAAIILDRHIEEEAGPMTKIGSTKKGVGAAIIERIRRNPNSINIASKVLADTRYASYVCKSVFDFNAQVDKARVALIESCQGYSLSLYHGFTPYTTSRDVSTFQILADCAVPAGSWDINVIGAHRTYPIRVANRYDENGVQVGWSGPGYPDQEEMDWDEIGVPAELTTVTKLPRRVFSFSPIQLSEAVRQNGVRELYMNFVNYFNNADEALNFLTSIDGYLREQHGAFIRYVGFGPNYEDMMDVFKTTINTENVIREYFKNRTGK